MDSDDVFRAAGMTSQVDMGDLTQALVPLLQAASEPGFGR